MWAYNNDSSVVDSFKADLGVAFEGLVTGGKFDAHIAFEDQYKTCQQSLTQTISCQGGDTTFCTTLSADPTVPGIHDVFDKWVGTTQTSPAVMGFSTVPLWTLMFQAQDATLKNFWLDFSKAYNFIVLNPQVHKTKVRMTIAGGYGEFDLLSPSSHIEMDPESPPPQGTEIVNSKIIWKGDPVQHLQSVE